jgi:hypothetical protein
MSLVTIPEFPERRRSENDVQYLARYHQWASDVQRQTIEQVVAVHDLIDEPSEAPSATLAEQARQIAANHIYAAASILIESPADERGALAGLDAALDALGVFEPNV